jgi:hypothetical protein
MIKYVDFSKDLDILRDETDTIQASKKLLQLINVLRTEGLAEFTSVSIDTILGYMYSALDILYQADVNDIENVIDDMISKIDSAINSRSDSERAYALRERNSHMLNNTPSKVALFNPHFDEGADTSTCVEIDGKIAGLAFSVKGIQKILRSNNLIVDDEFVRRTAARNGVLISEDSDEVYSPGEYANALQAAFSDRLENRICAGSRYTYAMLVEGYRTLDNKTAKSKIRTASEPYLDNLTTSQLRQLLLDTWMASNRAARFNRDKINYMDRDELIEAIKAQEQVPISTDAAFNSLMEEFDSRSGMDVLRYTAKQLKLAVDDYDELMLSGKTRDYLIDGDGATVNDSPESIKAALVQTGAVQTTDGSISIEQGVDEYIVTYFNDTGVVEDFHAGYTPESGSIYDMLEETEVFKGAELEEAIEFFIDLLSRSSLMATAKTGVPGIEVTDLSAPTTEEFNEAKEILRMEMEKREKLAKAVAEFTQSLQKELGIGTLSKAQYDRAVEIVFRKIRNFKRGMVKISEDRYARLTTKEVGGSSSLPLLREALAKHFDVEMTVIKNIEKTAVTEKWNKQFMEIFEPATNKVVQSEPNVYVEMPPEKKAAIADESGIMNSVSMFGELLDEILRIEEQINSELEI